MKFKQNTLAVIILCIIFTASGLRLWASYAAHQVEGPTLLAVNHSFRQLMVYVEGVFYRLNDTGGVVDVIKASELGLSSHLADLQWMDDGRLLIGDLTQKRIFRCELTSYRCLDLAPADSQAIQGDFRFFYSEADQQIYINDRQRNRLLVHDIERNSLRELRFVDEETLSSPMDVEWLDGALWVADSRNARLLQLYPDFVGHLIVGAQIHLTGSPSLKAYNQPLAFTQDFADSWWLILGNGESASGRLVQMDAQGHVMSQSLFEQMDGLEGVASLRDNLYFIGAEHFSVFQMDLLTHRVKSFAKDGLQQHLDHLADEKHYLQIAKRIATYTMLLALLVLVSLGIYSVRQRVPHVRAPIQPKVITSYPKLTWLCPESRAVAHFNTVVWVVMVGILVCAVAAISFVCFTYANDRLLELLPYVKLIIVLALVLPFLLWLMMQQARLLLQTQIAADEQYIYLTNVHGMVYQVEPKYVLFTKRQLAYKDLVIPLVGPFGEDLFPPVSFEQSVRPLLHKAQQVGEVSMMIYQVMQGNPLQRRALWVILMTFVILLIW